MLLPIQEFPLNSLIWCDCMPVLFPLTCSPIQLQSCSPLSTILEVIWFETFCSLCYCSVHNPSDCQRWSESCSIEHFEALTTPAWQRLLRLLFFQVLASACACCIWNDLAIEQLVNLSSQLALWQFMVCVLWLVQAFQGMTSLICLTLSPRVMRAATSSNVYSTCWIPKTALAPLADT